MAINSTIIVTSLSLITNKNLLKMLKSKSHHQTNTLVVNSKIILTTRTLFLLSVLLFPLPSNQVPSSLSSLSKLKTKTSSITNTDQYKEQRQQLSLFNGNNKAYSNWNDNDNNTNNNEQIRLNDSQGDASSFSSTSSDDVDFYKDLISDKSSSSSIYLEQQQQQQQIPTPLPLIASIGTSASNLNHQHHHHHPDAPKIIPLSALERYQEGAELKLFCSASTTPNAEGRLQFEWRKNQVEQLLSSSSTSSNQINLQSDSLIAQVNQQQQKANRNVYISMMDDSSSILRISHLEADDSGNYTCLAKNQHGFDSSTVRINVNVRLKWLKEPPSEIQIKAGKSVQLECDATGQPTPLISWTSLKDHQTINTKILRIDRAKVNDSGLYECRVISSNDNVGSGNSRTTVSYSELYSNQIRGGENNKNQQQLKKIVKLTVNELQRR